MNPIFDSGGFDDEANSLEGWHLWIRFILLIPLVFLTLLGIFLRHEIQLNNIWGWMKKTNSINPFSVANYAHAFAEHWEWQPEEQYNRWNLP